MPISYIRHMVDMGDGTAAVQAEILKREAESTHFYNFAPAAIPGKYQTEDYARVRLIEAHSRLGLGWDVEKTVRLRMERAALTEDEERSFSAVICESVLYGATADREIMLEQLRHLVHLMRRPNVDLRILRTGTRVPTPLNHFDITDGAVTVETEALTYVITGDEPEIGLHMGLYDDYARVSSSGLAAENLIGQAFKKIQDSK